MIKNPEHGVEHVHNLGRILQNFFALLIRVLKILQNFQKFPTKKLINFTRTL